MVALLFYFSCFVVGVLLCVVVCVLCVYVFFLYIVCHVCRPCCFIALVLLLISVGLCVFVRYVCNSCTCTLCLIRAWFVVLHL